MEKFNLMRKNDKAGGKKSEVNAHDFLTLSRLCTKNMCQQASYTIYCDVSTWLYKFAKA